MLNSRLIVAGVILALIGATGFYIRHLRGEISDLQVQNTTLSAKNGEYESKMSALIADANTKQAAAAQALKEAQDATEKAKAKATSFYKAKQNGDACQSALDLVNGGVK